MSTPTVAPSTAPTPPPGSPGGPLAGITVLDLATVGPAARCTRLLADYGATVVKVGHGARPRRRAPPPALLRLQRLAPPAAWTALDLKDADGRERLPGPGPRRGRGGRELPARCGRPLGHRLRRAERRQPADHPVLHHRVRPGRAPAAIGPATTSTTWPWAATWPAPSRVPTAARRCRGRPSPTRPAAGCRRRWPSWPRSSAGASGGPGTHLDVAIADGVLWLTSLAVDEHLATGAPVGHGQSMVTGRYACYDTYRAADGGWLAVGAIEPRFFANLCRLLGCEEWVAPSTGRRSTGRDPGRLPDRLRHPGPRRLGGRAGRGRHLRDARPVAGRAGRRRPVPGPSRFRRGRRPSAAGERTPPVPPGRLRCSPAWHAPTEPVTVTDPARTDTDRLLAAAGFDPGGSPSCARGAWWRERHRCGRHRGPPRGRAVRGGGGVPGRAGLRVDELRLGGERQPAVLGRPRWPTR